MEATEVLLTKKILAPKLRFKGFNGNWNLLRLGELGAFKNGLNKDSSEFGHGSPFVNLMDIFGKTILEESNFGLVNATEKDIETYSLEKGDVLFIRSSVKRTGVGETILVAKDLPNTVYSGFLIRFRDKNRELGLNFKSYCFSNAPFRKELLSYATSSANTNINQESLAQIKLHFPTLPEQNEIASFLSAVDQKIRHLTRKKELLEQYKKGVMQQLFSGKLRFKGHSDKWQKIVFTECCDLIHGFQFREEHFESTGLPVIKIGSLVDNGSISFHNATYVSKDCEKTHSKFILKKGDVLMALTGGTLGKVSRIDKDYGVIFQNYRVGKFENKSNALIEYIYFLLQSRLVQNRLQSLVNEAAQPNFGKQDFDKIRFELPSLEEQKKIANYLSNIDNKIESVTKQITQTQTFKKGLLQQMFV